MSYGPARNYTGGPVATRRVDPNDAPFLGAIIESSRDIVGIQTAALYHKTATSATGDLTQTTAFGEGSWDEISADSVRIELVNSTGGARTLTDVVVRGMPVHRLQSLKYDRIVDYEDIARNGERVTTFGSGDVVTTTQLNKLGDHAAKVNGIRRHVYVVSMVGTRYDYRSGRWYRLQIGGSGESEYIDSVCECLYVQTSRRARGGPSTRIGFREVYEAWKFDSGAFARYRASGEIRALVGMGNELVIAASTWLQKADAWCDGTADQTEINLAITGLAARGGGIVRLTQGTYALSAAIEMKSNVSLVGAGIGATIIEKNCNDYAIRGDGASGSELTYIAIQDLTISQNVADTNADKHLVYLDYCNEVIISDVQLNDAYARALYCEVCDDIQLTQLTVNGCDTEGVEAIYLANSPNIILNSVVIQDSTCSYGIVASSVSRLEMSNIRVSGLRRTLAGGSAIGLFIYGTSYSILTNVFVDDIQHSDVAGYAHGVYIDSFGSCISNIHITNINNTTTVAESIGISIVGDDNVLSSVYVEGCSGTGVVISAPADRTMIAGGRSTSNGTNYTDSGTNTSISSFDVT